MKCCPKCGDDTQGYEYVLWCTDHRGGSWGEPSESAELVARRWPKTVRCCACGARVPIAKAQGEVP